MHNLPNELLLAIFLDLDLESIFTMRQVCRRIMEISKARSLWLVLLGRLQEEFPGLYCGNPYKALESWELEHFVRRTVILERKWSRGIAVCTRPPEEFSLEKAVVRYLVPGGRWLISGLLDGSSRLIYTDLDSPASGSFEVLRHPDSAFRGDVQRIALYLDTNPDTFSFTVAVTYFPSMNTSFSRVNGTFDHDWQENAICSVWDVKVGESEKFDVSHRTLFPLLYPEDFGTDSFVISRDRLLRGTDDKHARVFEVFDYLGSSNHQLRRGLVVLPRAGRLPPVQALRIMPHSQFLVVCPGQLQLFNMPELFHVSATSLHPSSGSDSPLWTYNFKPCIRRCDPAVTPPHLAFRQSAESSFGLLIQVDHVLLYVGLPPAGSSRLDVHEIIMEDQAGWMTAQVGSHRGVWYDRVKEGLLPYLTTFEYPGRRSVVRELAGSNRGMSNSPESLSIRSVPYKGLQEFIFRRHFWYFDEASGRLLIPKCKIGIAFILLQFA